MPDEKAWVIRDVPEITRRKVKKWAGEWGVTIAEALERLVESGEKFETVQAAPTTRTYFRVDSPDDMAKLAELIADEMERRRKGGEEPQ